MVRSVSTLSVLSLLCVVFLCPDLARASGPCQLDKLTPESTGGCFGASVAINDRWAFVGDSCDDSVGDSSGSVTAFRREDFTWVRQSPKLVGSGVGFHDRFGFAVDVDGDVLVVGAPQVDPLDSREGQAFVFRRQGSIWVQEQILLPAVSADWDWFGFDVAVSGTVIAVGAPSYADTVTPTAYVFRWNGTQWVEEAAFTAPGPRSFGATVALDGSRLVVGSYWDGQRYRLRVYVYTSGAWNLEDELFTTDPFGEDTLGSGVSMSGDRIVVGARGSDEFGTNSGSAYIFRHDGGSWVQDAKLVGPQPGFQQEFGSAVAIDGTDILVATSIGVVYVFQLQAGVWTAIGTLPRPSEVVGTFATAMALESPYALVNGDSAAYTYFAPVCIPAASVWGLALLALGLLAGGALLLRRRCALRASCVLVLCLPCAVSAQTEELAYHPEHLIVRFKPEVDQSARDAVHAALGAQRLRAYRHFEDLVVVRVDPSRLDGALTDYSARREVARVERDYLRYFASAPECPPDDFDVGKLWGIDRIRGPEAWCVETGSADVRVAVIDGGLYFHFDGVPHVDLAANVWTNAGEIPGNDIDDDENGYVDDVHGYDFWTDDGYPRDPDASLDWHGTHIAGTIAAVGNNATGVVGVNWHSSVVALRVAGPGTDPPVGPYTTEVSRILAALDYCIANDIKVANLSVSSGAFSAEECDAIAQAGEDVGLILVVAAGNEGRNLDVDPEYPAACEVANIITVAATDTDNDLWYTTRQECECDHIVENGDCDLRTCDGSGCYEHDCHPEPYFRSNYGDETVHLSAPGKDIYSTIGGDAYGYSGGTSFAAPHVAGVVALMMSRYPDWTYTQIRDRILERVQPAAHPPGKTMTDGIVDAYAALIDCNDNGIDDECDIDCGPLGGACDVTGCGQSFDCDANAIPDDCEADCNGNGLRDTCDLATGTSEDCNANAVPDECEDCDDNGIIDHCDFDCTAMNGTCNVPGCGARNDCNADCVPDACQCNEITLSPPTAVPGGVGMNRYVGIVPANPGCRTALHVLIDWLPESYGFEGFAGTLMWVDEPVEVCESSAQTTPPCTPSGTSRASRLTCEAVYRDWSTVGPIYVYDDEIVASAAAGAQESAMYAIAPIHDGCPTIDPPNARFTMALWGDVTGGWDGSSWTAPDGVVDQDDIDAVVAKYQNLTNAPIKARADLDPDVPNRLVNFIDIGKTVDAYHGYLYPYDGPSGCPM